MSYKILHFADLHLDASFARQGLSTAYGVERRLDLRAVLTRILARARELKVDAITIAGDLYEQEFALPETANFLVREFARIAPIRVIIAPGERDPYTNESLYALMDWPENVDIFYQNKLTPIALTKKITIWGAAYPPARSARLLDNFQVPSETINLLLLHAANPDSAGAESENLYTIDAAQVQKAGFQFALLGHEHIGQNLATDTLVGIYPGTPEPISPREETGTHQVVLLNIQDQVCTSEIVSVRLWHYQSLEIQMGGLDTQDVLTQMIDRAVNQVLTSPGSSDRAHTVFNIRLTGNPDFHLDLQGLYTHFEGTYIHFDALLTLGYDVEQLAQEQTVRGLLVRDFQASLSKAKTDDQRRLILTAFRLALQALDGEQVHLYETDRN